MDKKIKICMLTSRRNPFDSRMYSREAKSLANNGFEVYIIAPYIKNITIPTDDTVNFCLYKKSRSILRVFITPFLLIKACLEIKADVCHCHDEHLAILAGILYKIISKINKKQVKLIYDSYEYTPGSLARGAKTIFARYLLMRLAEKWERIALKFVDLVFTANQIVRAHILLLNRFTKVEILFNCPPYRLWHEKENNTQKEYFVVGHEGHMFFNRGLMNMVEVIKRFKRDNDKVKLLIIGNVNNEEREYLTKEINKHNLHGQIELTGRMRYEEIGEKIQDIDVGLSVLLPTINNMLAGHPNKIFNYMRFGKPVIAVDFPEIKSLIEEASSGLLIKTDSVDDLYNAIKYLKTNEKEKQAMGRNGFEIVKNKYNWENMEKKLLASYRAMLLQD